MCSANNFRRGINFKCSYSTEGRASQVASGKIKNLAITARGSSPLWLWSIRHSRFRVLLTAPFLSFDDLTISAYNLRYMDAKDRLIQVCKVMSHYRLNGTQLSILALIPENNAKNIAQAMGEKEANVHAAIRSLKRRGYIGQTVNQQNKRTRITQVTDDKGKELMLELAKAFV